jgi:hypothetical protein
VKPVKCFLYSSAAILLFLGIAKLISSVGAAGVLSAEDPLTEFSFKSLFRIVGGVELVVALVCILSKRIWVSMSLLAWLATSIVAYRFYLFSIAYNKPCSCLGNLTDALHISPQTADTAMKIILAYLLIGSYGSLFWLWRQRKKAAALV